MRLLLDTHIAVWAAMSPTRLSTAQRRILESPQAPPVLSAVSVWELRLKWDRVNDVGVRKGPIDPKRLVLFASLIGWDLLPVTMQHAAATLREPLGHSDAFDELLLVQAQEERLQLLTRDGKLLQHPLAIGG